MPKDPAALRFSSSFGSWGTFIVHAGQIISIMLYLAHKIVKGGIHMTFKKFLAALINTHFYLVH